MERVRMPWRCARERGRFPISFQLNLQAGITHGSECEGGGARRPALTRLRVLLIGWVLVYHLELPAARACAGWDSWKVSR